MSNKVTLKLIGAQRYISRNLGITSPVEIGGKVTVTEEQAAQLLEEYYVDSGGNEKPVFTDNMQDSPTHNVRARVRTVQKHIAEEREEAEAAAKAPKAVRGAGKGRRRGKAADSE